MNLKSFVAHEAYHGFLRKPVSFASSFLLNSGLYPKGYQYEILQAHFNSSEVSIHHLTKLYGNLKVASSTPNIALIHIPKTAGTSVRVAIGKELGIAPISNYRTDNSIRPENWNSIAFWPFLAGHTNVFNFPESHVGITFFREPRSRLLSSYRYIEKDALSQQPQSWKGSLASSFSDWLLNAHKRTSARLFFPGTDEEFFGAIQNQSDVNVTQQLRKGLSRVTYAGWSHETSSTEALLYQVFGKPIALPRLNIFNQSREYRPIYLTTNDLEVLESVTRYDQLLIDVASNLALITPLSKSEGDAIFEKSAERLGFTLP